MITMKTLTTSLVLLTTSFAALGQVKGPLTPTSVTYTFNSAQLTMFDGENYGLFQKPIQHTFRKSDPDFGNAELEDVTIKYGRYKSISLCFNTNIAVTIDGSQYKGTSGLNISQGDMVYGQANGTVSTTPPASVQNITVSASSLEQNCTVTYFKKPLCVTPSGLSNDCVVGDEIYTSEGRINPGTGEVDLGLGAAVKLQVSFLMDMLNSVIINADTGEVTTAPAVKIVLGEPGAAVHLGKWDNDGTTDVSFIFSNDMTLLSVMSSEYPGSHAPGFCSGQSNAYVTSVPVGSSLPENSINFITFFDELSGKVAYPSTSMCPDESNCSPNGFNIFDNLIQEIASSTSVNCVDENSPAVPSVLLDFGYTTVGSGEMGGPQVLTVQRIVDPTNMLGICTPTSNGVMAGRVGVCTYAGADADGY